MPKRIPAPMSRADERTYVLQMLTVWITALRGGEVGPTIIADGLRELLEQLQALPNPDVKA